MKLENHATPRSAIANSPLNRRPSPTSRNITKPLCKTSEANLWFSCGICRINFLGEVTVLYFLGVGAAEIGVET